MSAMRYLVLLSVLLGLSGCATTSPSTGSNDQPVAQQTATNSATERAKAHTSLGMAYFSDRRMSVALDEARYAMAADPNYPLAYNLMAVIRMALDENAAAEENFSKALRLAPNDPEINNNYGWFLCQTSRFAESFSYYETAARNPLNPQPTRPMTNAGFCAYKQGDIAASESYFRRALKMDPANADAWSMMAELSFFGGRYDEAQSHLQELQRLVDLSAASLWLGIRVERKLGNREAEARYAALLRRNFPSSAEYQKYLRGSDE